MILETQGKTLSDVFDTLTRSWNAHEPFVVEQQDTAPPALDSLWHTMWVLGYPIAVTADVSALEGKTVGSLTWNRPTIIRTAHPDITNTTAIHMLTYAPKLEMLPASAWDVRRAIIDAQLFEETDYMLPAHITKVVIAYGNEHPPLPQGDVYFLFSQLAFHYIPDNHLPQDIVICEVKPIYLREIRGGKAWSQRAPLACVVDPRMLRATEIEHIVDCCERMRIPTIPPNPDEAAQFKVVFYPVSERFMHYSLPRTFTYILGRFTYIITTVKGAQNYPMVYRDVSYAQDGELIAHCLLAYSVFGALLNDDPAYRTNEFVDFLKNCTWEGILYRMLGGTLDSVVVL
ncbi:MAG: hypothetical protein QXT00_07925 [Ignisphaera sp.]